MNPYFTTEDYYKDVLKYVDLMLAAHYEAIDFENSASYLGWQTKRQTEPSIAYRQEASYQWDVIRTRCELTLSTSVLLPLEYLVETFKLSEFEIFCLFLSVAVEIDPSFERSVRFFNETLDSPNPTFGLMMKIFAQDADAYLSLRQNLSSHGKLLRFFYTNAYKTASFQPLIGIPLALDSNILDFILAFDSYKSHVPFLSIVFPHEKDDSHHFAMCKEQLTHFVEHNHEKQISPRLFFHLHGPKGIGKHALVYDFCNHYDQTIVLVNCKRLMLVSPLQESIDVLLREVLIHRAVLVFESFECLSERLHEPEISSFVTLLLAGIADFVKVCFSLSHAPWHPQNEFSNLSVIDIPLQTPNHLARAGYLVEASKNYPLDPQIDLFAVANKFKLNPKQMDKALRDAYNQMLWSNKNLIDEAMLHRANYFQLAHQLSEKTQRLESPYNFESLILPKEPLKQIEEACNQMRFRHVVYQQWGFDKKVTYGTGLGMLFTGPPGTGKTLTAQVIANELGLELYRVDLSQVISKYIGETEKQLKAIFDEAALSSAILLFDEGDALFAKRTEVSDAHDKYANVETSYLLQKIESYEGIAIVTTNLLGNIDEAFIRRFAFVVHFPLPTADYRRQIWRHVFPKETPLSEMLDLDFLANRFELTGGNIKNIALNAAFLAASKNRPIQMKDLLLSVMSEISKTGKVILPADFGEYAYLLTNDFMAP